MSSFSSSLSAHVPPGVASTALTVLRVSERVVFVVFAFNALRVWRTDGLAGLLAAAARAVRALPGVNPLIRATLRREVQGAVRLLANSTTAGGDVSRQKYPFPAKGVDKEELLRRMDEMREKEQQAEEGKLFAYVYTGNSPEHMDLMVRAFERFTDDPGHRDEALARLQRAVFEGYMHGNALNPAAFPSLRVMETQVVSMVADMFHADGRAVGSMTSGGTESILLAVKTYRDLARERRPHVKEPEMVMPITGHPAFEKAAHYFGVKIVHVPVADDYTVDVEAFRRAITSNTILLVGSAPQYCHCVIDPIPELSAIAVEKGIPLHVDACFGGFMLPWVEALGFPVTPFDFRLAGVTSMSADLHKYGFSIKGNSVLVFRDEEVRRHQYFSYSGWPGGLFGSPSILGTRPGGNIATGWATLMALGREGFTNIARDCMRVTQAMIDGVNAVDGLTVLGKPPMTAFSFASTDPSVDILSVADIMEERGWRMERQQLPNCLHCSVMPAHVLSYQQFCKDVAEAVEMCRRDKSLAKKGTAGMYGMVASIPDKTIIDDFIVGYLSEMYKAT